MITIHKSAGIVIKERRILVVREYGEKIFHSPGGVIRNKETPIRALVREMIEETGIRFSSNDIHLYGTYQAIAANDRDKILNLEVYMINNWSGEVTPGKEIEEIAWVTSDNPQQIFLGSIFEHEVIPDLKKKNLID
jgi:8-oxo-dGTP pyrophosphatase MutT (NUDIX family)